VQVSQAAYTKVPLNWRDMNLVPSFNRFYLIEEGEGFIRFNNRDYYPVEGHLLLIPAGGSQSYSVISEHTYGKYWCHFQAEISTLHSMFHWLEAPVCLKLEQEQRQRWRALFQNLITQWNSPDLAAGLRVGAIVAEMLAAYIELSGAEVKILQNDSNIDKLNRIVTYMEERLANKVTVEELAALVHYHPNYFIEVFKQLTGQSPIQYLNAKRIEHARQQLQLTREPVSVIAEEVGMTPYYFSRLFKEQTGYSPTAYRQFFEP